VFGIGVLLASTFVTFGIIGIGIGCGAGWSIGISTIGIGCGGGTG